MNQRFAEIAHHTWYRRGIERVVNFVEVTEVLVRVGSCHSIRCSEIRLSLFQEKYLLTN